MTKEEIIRMARAQGLPETEIEGVFRVNSDDLGRMLAAEREANIKATRAVQAAYDKKLDGGPSVEGSEGSGSIGAVRSRSNT